MNTTSTKPEIESWARKAIVSYILQGVRNLEWFASPLSLSARREIAHHAGKNPDEGAQQLFQTARGMLAQFKG